MTSDPSLNTPARTYGAAMVSGTLWTTYTFTPGALSFAKYSSGPVILWAKPGEEKNVSDALTPTLSALEVRAAEMNTRAAFERLYWVAGGKIRHSVRWKTGWAVRRFHAEYALICNLTLHISSQGPAFWKREKVWYKRKHHILKDRRFEGHCHERMMKPIRVEAVGGNKITDAEQLGRLYKVLLRLRVMSAHMEDAGKNHSLILKDIEDTGAVIAFARMLGDRVAIANLVRLMQARRSPSSFAALLKYLEATAYRVHLTRRVKPVQRRTRAPRPLYARPQPPTAPTAPPLHEASA